MSSQDLRPFRFMGVTLHLPVQSEGTSQETSSANLAGPNLHGHLGGSVPPPPVNVEASDDDVLISSPSAFEAAKNNARRARRRTPVVDLESDDGSGLNAVSRRQRRRCDSCVERESQTATPPPPPEPVFSCPICMGPFNEAVTTKCGHIFCKSCILQAIVTQNKCPTCRRKVVKKDIIRVFLPSTN